MRSAPKDAGHAEYRVYRTSAELDELLETTGGEVTPEVDALMNRLAKDWDAFAAIAVGMRKDADAEMARATAERARLSEVTAFQKSRKTLATDILRRVAAERGERSFRVGTYTVRLDEPQPRVVAVSKPSQGEGAWLVGAGLAEYGLKPFKSAIGKALKAGEDVPGYTLEYPSEKKVVVT